MSWPVSGALMIEPTESESKEELDRYIGALIRCVWCAPEEPSRIVGCGGPRVYK